MSFLRRPPPLLPPRIARPPRAHCALPLTGGHILLSPGRPALPLPDRQAAGIGDSGPPGVEKSFPINSGMDIFPVTI